MHLSITLPAFCSSSILLRKCNESCLHRVQVFSTTDLMLLKDLIFYFKAFSFFLAFLKVQMSVCSCLTGCFSLTGHVSLRKMTLLYTLMHIECCVTTAAPHPSSASSAVCIRMWHTVITTKRGNLCSPALCYI